jgi:hypothetical protein
MALGLIASSDRARDVAAAFVKFSTHVGQKADISVLVSELLAISASLRELDTAWRNSLHSYPRGIINDDIYTLLRSLEYTIKEVARHCGQLGWSGYPSSRDAYQDVWQKMEDYFYAEGGNSLLRRLEYYREFVDGLRRVVLGCVVARSSMLRRRSANGSIASVPAWCRRRYRCSSSGRRSRPCCSDKTTSSSSTWGT